MYSNLQEEPQFANGADRELIVMLEFISKFFS